MQGVRDLPADPLPACLSERRSMPGRRTRALAKVETESAFECPRTKDVRRATSPFDARPYPGERCGRGIRELGPTRFFRRPRVAGTIGRRSAIGTGLASESRCHEAVTEPSGQ